MHWSTSSASGVPDRPHPRLDFSRRAIVATLLAGAASAAASGLGLAEAVPAVDRRLVNRALEAVFRHHDRIWSRDVVAIADFGLPSCAPRFFLVDILAGSSTALRVTHGRGSDPEHSGTLQAFSDVIGSGATAEGAYLIGELYDGTHGPSRRLIGLDPTNAHAEERTIVIHSAWYADPALIRNQGKLGRSDGCFVFAEQDIGQVLTRLGRGRLLFAGSSQHG